MKNSFFKMLCITAVLFFSLIHSSIVYAQTTSDPPNAEDIAVINNVGKPDTVAVTGLRSGDIVNVYNAASGGKLLGTATVSYGKMAAAISVPQLGSAAGKVYVSVTNKWALESARTKADYPEEAKTDAPDSNCITVANNAGKPDTVAVGGVYGGAVVKVYNAKTGGRLLGTATLSNTKTEVSINITQLGIAAGKIYVSATNKGELESERTEVGYLAEVQTDKPSSDNITITNNAGKPDSVVINGLYGGEVIKLYNAEAAGRLVSNVTVPKNKTEVSINITQLGVEAGKLYVTVTYPGELESARAAIDYLAEPKSIKPSTGNITIINNAGISDTIFVQYLSISDVVKVYDAEKGGNLLGTATASSGKTDVTITIQQLDSIAGSVYVTVTSIGKRESDRVAVRYSSENKSTAPDQDDISIVNNGGTADTITVTSLTAGDVVKVYDSDAGGSLLGTATVASSKTEAIITVSQLDISEKNVYVSVTSKGKFESERTEAGYSAEPKSGAPDAGSIIITNNSGKSDTVYVTNLTEGDVVKVYNSASGGSSLGSAVVASGKTEATVTITQLGKSAGNVFVSVTNKNKLESRRTEVGYADEPISDMIEDYNITVTNNPTGKSDTVYITNLTAGDIVKVYNAASGGSVLGSATVASSKTEATITIAQLGTPAGSVYVTVTSANKLESSRIKADYVSESQTGAVNKDNIIVTNNLAGTSDTVEVTGLTEDDVVKVYNADKGGKLLGTATVPDYGSYATVTIPQLGTTGGTVYVSVTSANKAESARTPVDYTAESKSDAISADNIIVTNNAAGTSDTVEVIGLTGGDVVKVYDALRGGKLLGTGTVPAYGSYTTVTIPQLGTAAGSVYVSVTSTNEIESDRIKADYSDESKTNAISKDNINVINNARAADTVQVYGLATGDAVKVYDAARGGKLLGSETVSVGFGVTITIEQLSNGAGSVYVSVTNTNKSESDRTEAKYSAEPNSDAPDKSRITIINNAGVPDTVKVTGLTGGDAVNVYDSALGGSLLGTATAGTYDAYATVTITQLGPSAGSVYVSVTKKGSHESGRTMVSYIAEPKSAAPDTGNIIVSNNAGVSDTVQVNSLSGGDTVSVYDADGYLLGTATVGTYDSYATVTITQLGTSEGFVYVSIICKGKLESERTQIPYAAEGRSGKPEESNITVTNNAGVSDTVKVTLMDSGDIVKIYSKNVGGTPLASATVPSDDTEVTIKITQLGTSSGYIYVSVTSPDRQESERTQVHYDEESTTAAPEDSNIIVTNNAKIADTVTVTSLTEGDVVKVYKAATGGSALGTETVDTYESSATVTITQLGTSGGYVYVSVTSSGMRESTRTKVQYKAEEKSLSPAASKIIIKNNAGIADTITVTYLETGDVVKVYSASSGGSPIGTQAVSGSSTEVTIRITQLGTSAGAVYVSVTGSGKLESDRTKADYIPESTTDAPEIGSITVTNNSGKSDTVRVTDLSADDIIRVYDSATGGNLLGTITVATYSAEATVKITQLGTTSGYVYVSVTSPGANESSRTKAGYSAEN